MDNGGRKKTRADGKEEGGGGGGGTSGPHANNDTKVSLYLIFQTRFYFDHFLPFLPSLQLSLRSKKTIIKNVSWFVYLMRLALGNLRRIANQS